MPNSVVLFSKVELRESLRSHLAALQVEIDGYDASAFLAATPNELWYHFLDKARIDPITLHPDAITIDETETQIDLNSRDDRLRRLGQAHWVPGSLITYTVPYSGNRALFDCRPSVTHFGAPRVAALSDTELRIEYERLNESASGIRAAIDFTLDLISRYLRTIENDLSLFGITMGDSAKTWIAQRRERLSDNRSVAQSLGYPLKRRTDAPMTHTLPDIKRKAVRSLDSKPLAASVGSIADEEYDHILHIISNMVQVMERSPAAFQGMKEEDLRTHFLVQLNGQYEGRATGETFNAAGKTDILIRENGRNVFIAECKFWEGPEAFRRAIDQLLGYTSWRDAKTALLLFNRNKNFSAVLAQLPRLVESHSKCVRLLGRASDTDFRYEFRHPDDADQRLVLSILAFDVPT